MTFIYNKKEAVNLFYQINPDNNLQDLDQCISVVGPGHQESLGKVTVSQCNIEFVAI